ncbi:hypothetical protein MTR67_040282 [Solanum verrucosum]|uniref:Uncharacterized protein n=1 Tax=Solanum verrucosum TaxID=315347 RepID=A0AAF0UIP0_SOLVR|nr:hypothetical protein MTR67_040282 [Solanum verrucosum]
MEAGEILGNIDEPGNMLGRHKKIQLAMEFEEVSRNEEIAGGGNPGYNGTKMVTKTPMRFYQELYKEFENRRPDFTLQGNTRISTEEQVWPERQLEEDEILEGLKQCAIDKAPGPDGFPMSFFIALWEMLKSDILLTLWCWPLTRFRKGTSPCLVTWSSTLGANLYAKYGHENPFCLRKIRNPRFAPEFNSLSPTKTDFDTPFIRIGDFHHQRAFTPYLHFKALLDLNTTRILLQRTFLP